MKFDIKIDNCLQVCKSEKNKPFFDFQVDMNAKMSKSKKKKLKKRAKRNQALMEETMQHIEEVEREEQMQETDTKTTVNGGEGIAGSSPASSGPDREAAPTSNNSTTKLAGMSIFCFMDEVWSIIRT